MLPQCRSACARVRYVRESGRAHTRECSELEGRVEVERVGGLVHQHLAAAAVQLCPEALVARVQRRQLRQRQEAQRPAVIRHDHARDALRPGELAAARPAHPAEQHPPAARVVEALTGDEVGGVVVLALALGRPLALEVVVAGAEERQDARAAVLQRV